MANTKNPLNNIRAVGDMLPDAVRNNAGAVVNSAKGMVGSVQNIQPVDVIQVAMKVPGVRIDRETYLRKELIKYYPEDVVNNAIEHNPAYAGIDRKKINRIANHAIDYETHKVTAISFAAGIPGGAAMALTVSADIAQYYGFILRAMQKLAYLYGFPDLELNQDHIDDETMDKLLAFLGVMFGVNAANTLVKSIAEKAARQTSKSIAQRALTKGTIYPIVKKIAQAVGVKMTKQVFAGGVSKVVPVVGGVVSGGLSYATFKPCVTNLKNEFERLPLSDPEFYKKQRETKQEEH